jgi:hypothetical protein
MLQLAILILPAIAVLAVIIAVIKNGRPGRKGKYRYSFFQKK